MAVHETPPYTPFSERDAPFHTIMQQASMSLSSLEGAISGYKQHGIVQVPGVNLSTENRLITGLELRWGEKIELTAEEQHDMDEWDKYLEHLSSLRFSSVPKNRKEVAKSLSTELRIYGGPMPRSVDLSYFGIGVYLHDTGETNVVIPTRDRTYVEPAIDTDSSTIDHVLLEAFHDAPIRVDGIEPVRRFDWSGKRHRLGTRTTPPWSGTIEDDGTVIIRPEAQFE